MISAKRRRASATTHGSAQTLAGSVAPASIELAPRFLRVGDGYAATLVVTGYPAEVGAAWLEPLLSWPALAQVTTKLPLCIVPLIADLMHCSK